MIKPQIKEYLTSTGKNPFREWIETLDKSIKARVQARIFRVEQGNLGDHKSVGHGIWESRIQFGPGFRIYFGKDGSRVILLLCAGDKSTQAKDIKKAQLFWLDYLERKEND